MTLSKYLESGKIASGVVGSLLTAFLLWLVGEITKFPNVLVPPAAVVAFDSRACPKNSWHEFGAVAGRTIIGSGEGKTTDGRLLSNRDFAAKGGEQAYRLTVKQLPTHHHEAGTLANDPGTLVVHNSPGGVAKDSSRLGGLFVGYELKQSLPHTHKVTGDTADEGSGEPYEVMPPYYVLTYCVKDSW